MLNRWIRWFILLFGVMNLAHCIYSGCVSKWEVACCEFTTALLLFLLALYDWTTERRLSATRRKWFRNGWIRCQNRVDQHLLNRYRHLLDVEKSTTSPRVDEVNRTRCRILGCTLWGELRFSMDGTDFNIDDDERKNCIEDS